MSGCCIHAAPRDYARFGQFIFIDPKRKLVIVSNADWAGSACAVMCVGVVVAHAT